MSLLVKDTNVMSDADLGITVPAVTQSHCKIYLPRAIGPGFFPALIHATGRNLGPALIKSSEWVKPTHSNC